MRKPGRERRRPAIGSIDWARILFSGGSFVFGPGNVDLYAHVSETFGDSASPSALLAALA